MLTYRKLQTTKISSDFRNAVEIVSVTRTTKVQKGNVLVKMLLVGVNASDINFTAGRYSLKHNKPPFDVGFEGIGQVVNVGEGVTKLQKGDYVVVWQYGCFAEYMEVRAKGVIKIPAPRAEFLAMITSGLTASISLSAVGEMKSGQTVLVTAAAGATGAFAVQLAKLAGNTVIGTCSSEKKVEFLRKIGCDRPVNYKKENLDEVLAKEFPNGVDIVYESVGGKMFEVALKHLARYGKLIIIGLISQYQDQTAFNNGIQVPLPSLLLSKSASVRGFFLPHFLHLLPEHITKLFKLFESDKLIVPIDPTPFNGLESVADAIDHMYSSTNVGKVVVHLAQPDSRSKL